jgi:signal transduction histidine kinase
MELSRVVAGSMPTRHLLRTTSVASPWFAGAVAAGLTLAVVVLVWLASTLLLPESQPGSWFLVVVMLAGLVFALGLGLVLQTVRASVAGRRSELVSSMTHELKTPVATVRAAGETLLSGRVTGPDAAREYAQIVVDQAKRLTRLLDNLLAYARMTEAADVYTFQPVFLGSLVNDTLRDFRAQLEAAGFAIDVRVPTSLPPVRADRTAVGLLLGNLVDNAVRYSRTTRWIGVTARAGDGVVMLDVADRGDGIPPDEIAKVTGKFYRGRRVSTDGSGLGLAIASRIVADHGGTLEVQSKVDEGTTVRVTLPVAQERLEEQHEATDSGH